MEGMHKRTDKRTCVFRASSLRLAGMVCKSVDCITGGPGYAMMRMYLNSKIPVSPVFTIAG
jgi:hypothetical protein